MTPGRPLRVVMLGLRGFPGVQGGVEAHVENLCPLLVEMGCEITVFSRSAYRKDRSVWKGVHFYSYWAPKSKGLEALVHSFLGVLYAGLVNRPDVLHIHAIGPALMTPLARLLGLKVVVTHHGPDYERQKWGRIGRSALRIGERFGMRWAQGRIVISDVIRRIVLDKHKVNAILIPNGVSPVKRIDTVAALSKFGLNAGRYVLLVSRLVPEKRHFDLIEAYQRAAISDWHLVIVGASDHPDNYANEVLQRSSQIPGVICTGFQSGVALQELFSHAGLFVLPSSHEGLPISLLEALSFGLPVIASDIPANLELGLPAEHYFALGNVDQLARRLDMFTSRKMDLAERDERIEWVLERYNWRSIAKATLGVYQNIGK